MYKIAVIVPVYNAETTIENCINSVINQTFGFDNIELILVDDNSTDNSKKIITNYSNKYNNIKPIFLNKNTGSPSQPRNIGIENSTAPYLMFLDNDDEYSMDYCETLYNSIINNDVDFVNCNHASKLNGQIYIPDSIHEINLKEEVFEGDRKILLKLACWANIYDSSFIKKNNIKFPTTLYEDGVFYLHCILKTNKPVIKLSNYPGYIYLIENEDSITHSATLKMLSGFLDGYVLCQNLFKENNREDLKQCLNYFFNMPIFILSKIDDLDEGIRILFEFENSLGYDIVLGPKHLNLVNNKIKNKKFFQAKILLKLMGLLYNNSWIKNFIFIRYSGLKLLK